MISRFIYLYPGDLYISKDDSITVSWIIGIRGKKAVKYILDKYGLLPGTFKDYMSRKYYNIILKYEKEGLTHEIRNLIEKLHQDRKILFDKWIREKEGDYFYKFINK